MSHLKDCQNSYSSTPIKKAPCFPDRSKEEGQLVNIWAFKEWEALDFPVSLSVFLTHSVRPYKAVCWPAALFGFIQPSSCRWVKKDLPKWLPASSHQTSLLRNYFWKHFPHWLGSHFSDKKAGDFVFPSSIVCKWLSPRERSPRSRPQCNTVF